MGSAIIIATLSAVVAALVIALMASRQRRPSSDQLVDTLRQELEQGREASISSAVDTLVSVAREQLGAHTMAGTRELDTRNELMDQRLDGMHQELDRVTCLVRELERERARKLGELSSQLARTGQSTAELTQVTHTLREALSSSQSRGQWGERMADDVLRMSGFVEGVNYHKQVRTGAGRPDVTFPLPGGKVVHMDVKFPLANYLRYLDAGSDIEREGFRKSFLKDVRGRLKEVTSRDYIDPAAGTLDYVLLFIPNEHVYGFIHEQDRDLVDIAISSRVILCSPLTLFAVLAVVRQAVDNFALEQTSNEILELLTSFGQQWTKFTDQMETVGKRLDSTRKAYDGLLTTRRRQLDRTLEEVGELRASRGSQPPARLAVLADSVGDNDDDEPMRHVAS